MEIIVKYDLNISPWKNHYLKLSMIRNISFVCIFLKQKTHLAPYIVITILLTIFFMLYFTSLWLFCNYQFVLLNPFIFFTPTPLSHLATIKIFSVSMSLFLFFLFVYLFIYYFLDCICKWKNMPFVFLCLTFHSVQYPFGSSMLLQMAKFHSFSWLSHIPLYVCTTSLCVHLLMTLRMLPYLGYCK